MAQTKRMPLGEIKRLTTLALSTQGAAEQRNRTKTQKVWNCNSRYDPPPKLSPGPYWLWARKFCQDHNDVTPSLKDRRPQIMSRFIVALSCGQTLLLCCSCHKGVTLRNVFSFCLSSTSVPPSLDETDTVFVLLFFLFEYSPLFFWIHRGTLHNSAVPHHLQKEETVFREMETLRSDPLSGWLAAWSLPAVVSF